MANLRTSTDILFDALWRSGEAQGANSEYYGQAVVYMNRAYQSICSGGSELDPNIDETWWWLRKPTPGVLTLQPSFNVASAAVVQGSAQITYSEAPLNNLGTPISLNGWFFSVTGDNGDVYRIADHIAGGLVATLDSAYTYSSNPAAAQRTMCFQYQLASDLKSVVGRMRAYQQNRYFINYSELDPLRQEFPIPTVPTGVPILFAMVGEQVAEFSHYTGDDPTDIMRVEYDYTFIPPDLVDDGGVTSPLIPFQYNRLLSDWTAYLILADKDDQKSMGFFNSAKSLLNAMSREHRRRAAQSSNLTGKIMPRQGDVKRRDSPMRTQAGLIVG
jgi:hypothetical protein